MRFPSALALALALAVAGCRCDADAPADAAPPADAAADAAPPADADADAVADAAADAEPEARCPPEMVRVARRFCVDRWESMTVDANGRELSPFYTPAKKLALYEAKIWETQKLQMGTPEAQAVPLPPLPAWQRQDFEPRAVARPDVVPQGYTSGEIAQRACENAGKRLCSLLEWKTACRGERDRQFPYGEAYETGRCNVYREAHPAKVLHDDVTIGHTDPRLNQVRVKGKALLRRTGETTTCISEWEGDGIADMVGNLDEWIEDPDGTFVGGFFSRTTREGCESKVEAHGFDYLDYSTGIRCCKDL